LSINPRKLLNHCNIVIWFVAFVRKLIFIDVPVAL
jgi:hypothetical protein